MSLHDFLEKYRRPLFRPDEPSGAADGGADDAGDGGGGAPDAGGAGAGDGGADDDAPKEGHRIGLRDQIKRSITELSTPEGERDSKGKFTKGAKKPVAGQQAPQEGKVELQDGAQAEAPAADSLPMPEGMSKEAAADWAKTPKVVQAAIIKRIDDQNKGVQELKTKYETLDKALEPHLEAIRQFNTTPAQAVERLFSWFQALAKNPGVSFPALAKSFGYDWNKLAKLQVEGATQAAGQQGQQGQEGQPPGEIPPAVQQYIDSLKTAVDSMKAEFGDRFGTLEQTFATQQYAKTEENLGLWAKDKPYFEEARGFMAQLIQSGAVPLKNGVVDLDKAYDTAIWAIPEIRAKMDADRKATEEKDRKDKEAADAKARADQVQQARRRGSSVTTGAPGAATQGGQKPASTPGKRKSVRESLLEAIGEANDR